MVYYSLSGYNSGMFLVGILSWWYGKGFYSRINIIKHRLLVVSDTFSIGLLIRTLLNPFRQISANGSGSTFSEKVQAFFDKLLSRIIGAVVRSFMVLFGSVVIILQVIFGIISLLFWLILPILPFVGLFLMIMEWTI
jgi:hypothetical protein